FEKDWDGWSAFGGGGCEINRGGDAKNFCLAGWALIRQGLPELQIGAEMVHQTPSKKSGRSSNGVGAGGKNYLPDNYHLLGYVGPSLQNTNQTSQFSWYTAMLFTF